MKKIILGRGQGKTTELIKLSHETNTYILVANFQRQREVAKMADEMGLSIPYPVTVCDYMRTHFLGSYIKHILIDDADDVLQQIFNCVTIDAITMSPDEEAERHLIVQDVKRMYEEKEREHEENTCCSSDPEQG